ncbi:MAG: DNA methyltransferase [Thermus sp.]|uniref:DNA methyltransferase n=1 Tax=Thermus sp. TaxID=275 RepID=UPI003D0F7E38
MKRAWEVYAAVLQAARARGLEGGDEEVAKALLAWPKERFRAFARELGLKEKYLRHDLLPVAFLPEPLRWALQEGLPLRQAHRLHRLLKRGELSLEDLLGKDLEGLLALLAPPGEVDPSAPVWLFPPEPWEEALPRAVAQALVLLYTKAGELVVDPMAGRGTVVEAAQALGRRAWGGDIAPRGPKVERADIRDLPKRFRGEASLVVLHPPTFQTWLREEGHREEAEERYGEYIRHISSLLDLCRPALAPGGKLVLVARPRRALAPRDLEAGQDFFLAPFERALAEADFRPRRYHLAVSQDGRQDWHLFVGESGEGGGR